MTSNNMFRQDINALRAIAVLGVMIFHFNPAWLSGGFSGVDVFFVISGFLMTGIILRGIEEKNSFSVLDFYTRRSKRIIPALAGMIFTILLVGFFIIPPIPYAELGKNTLSSLLFVSNWFYAGDAGYFAPRAEENILLHTWSLSIEWQFYLAFPLILIALKKLIPNKHLKWGVLALFIIALFAYITSQFFEIQRYYSSFLRAWELLLGSVVFAFPLKLSNAKNQVMGYAGITLIITSFVYLDGGDAWPNMYAQLPVFGAALIINSKDSLAVLKLKPLQWIGTISYSLYLAHWPVMVLAKNEVNAWYLFAIILAFSLFIYWFFEKKNFTLKVIFMYVVVVIACCMAVKKTNGFSVLRITSPMYQLNFNQFYKNYFGGKNSPDGIIYEYINTSETDADYIFSGDSFARQYSYYIINNKNLKVIRNTTDACRILPHYSTKNPRPLCVKRFDLLTNLLDKNKKAKVIISQAWDRYDSNWVESKNLNTIKIKKDNYLDFIESELSYLFSIYPDRDFVLLGSPQRVSEAPFTCQAKNALKLNPLNISCPIFQKRVSIPINQFLIKLSNKFKNVRFIDPNNVLCKGDNCSIYVNQKIELPIYADNNHLTIFGSMMVGQYIFNILPKLYK